VGIGETKLQAKTATGFAKPGGVARLTWGTWLDVMGDRLVTSIWGIGARTARRLEELGVRTVRELSMADRDDLSATFGPTIGPGLKVQALGGGGGPVVGEARLARGRSRETTFTRDVSDPVELDDHLVRLATEVTESVVAEGRTVTHVAVKVRTASFFTRTKISKLPAPTTDPAEVARAARLVLGRFELARAVRLLGVRVVLAMPS
jgi:DNA polymerase-4